MSTMSTMSRFQNHLRSRLALALVAGSVFGADAAVAQPYPVTEQQRATAQQVASAGVALSELRPDAPARYTVAPGDTLWAISALFLNSPWRWPELWGMNLQDIRNPHLIYPGQTLRLDTSSGRARLSLLASDPGALPTVKLSPRTRVQSLADNALPTLQTHLIEPFLSDGIIVDEAAMANAPRIVAAQDSRVLLTRGDRAYARSSTGDALIDEPRERQRAFRIFRNATPLKDPVTGEVLGFEAQYLGRALLARSESVGAAGDGGAPAIVPATIDIVEAREEMRVGDRLLPEPERSFQSFAPHAPDPTLEARIVSIYGSAVANAAQNQVVAINRGSDDGLEVGHVLAILQTGAQLVDKTDAQRPLIRLPDERNGLLMVFRTFDRVSYGLVLDIMHGVKVGDRLASPL